MIKDLCTIYDLHIMYAVVVDTNVWFHGTYIHPGEISITIGSEFM